MTRSTRKRFISAVGFVALLLITTTMSCSRKLTFARSTVAPAAEGYVKLKKDQNNNTAIDVRIRNLANPRQLDPPKNVYVVWMETQHSGTRNIGTITSSTGLFSNKLKGSLQTVTPYKPTGFIITAEDNATVHYPGGYVVLRTK